VTEFSYSCGGEDLDSTGSCELDPGFFACAEHVCETGTGEFCRLTSDDTGGPDIGGCDMNDDCDDPTCACLTGLTEACNGTCTDSADGPTIRCPGG